LTIRIEPENEVERRIVAEPTWLAGAHWGEPRPGHPEGTVWLHVVEVLANIDRQRPDAEVRRKLRLVALVHDSFKCQVDRSRPRVGDNHHAVIARRFAERFTDDEDVLEITELHDDAYNAWALGHRHGQWATAESRARRLIARLGRRLPLYLAFYRADNETGDKSPASREWFEGLCREGQTSR
jgi:hypothetical protein